MTYELDGTFRDGDTPGNLISLELALPGRFILVRPAGAPATDTGPTLLLAPSLLAIAGAPTGDWESLPDLRPEGITDVAVAADWKLIVEQWLDALPRPEGTRRTFVPPNQLLEVNTDGAVLLQAIPRSAGRCVIRHLVYSVAGKTRKPRRPAQPPAWMQQDIEVAESTQAGLAAGIAEAEGSGPAPAELLEFRRSIRLLLPLARPAP